MPRKHLFGTQHRPVMAGAHGGTVHHGRFEIFTAHKVAWEIGLGLLAAVLVVLAGVAAWDAAQTYALTKAPNVLFSYYHYYDSIELARAARLVNPPAADRGYDSIEDLRALRLVNPPVAADRSYDAIEDLRALRPASPPLAADRSYDAIEDLRAQRLINKPADTGSPAP